MFYFHLSNLLTLKTVKGYINLVKLIQYVGYRMCHENQSSTMVNGHPRQSSPLFFFLLYSCDYIYDQSPPSCLSYTAYSHKKLPMLKLGGSISEYVMWSFSGLHFLQPDYPMTEAICVLQLMELQFADTNSLCSPFWLCMTPKWPFLMLVTAFEPHQNEGYGSL